MDYLGDFLNGSTVNLYFTTHNSAGAAIAPLSAYEAADVLVYKNSSNAQKTTTNGVTMTSPFDSITGLHNVAFDTSNNTGDTNFWAQGNDYTVVLSADTETVDSQVVVRALAQFSLENRCVNWAKVASPTTSVGLSGTTISASQVVASVTGAVASVTGLTASNLDATVSSRLASASYTAPPTSNQNADALLDRTDGIETGWTFRQVMRIFAAVLAGKLSGGGTGTEIFRSITDAKNRVTATDDSSGNRSAITLDAS